MPSQRLILGASLAILLVISAAAIGLDLKSRSDQAAVNHSVTGLKYISDLRLLIRRAESASRGFALTGDPAFTREFNESAEAIPPAFSRLLEHISDFTAESAVIEETRKLTERRLAVSRELIRLHAAGDAAGVAALIARAEGRTVTDAIGVNFDKAIAEEQARLADQSAQSRASGRFLLAVDLAGVVTILVLAVVLMKLTRRSNRALADSLSASMASNEALEAAVAERTEHLVAAHEELRLSAAVLRSTFHSMGEAVLVIDTGGEVLLANPAAEKMLRYRPGMNITKLRALSTVFHADGVTPAAPDELPATRALRGEEFDDFEMIVRPRSGADAVHLVISGRPLRDTAGAISGAALVYHDISASRETERKLQQSQKLDAIGKLTGGVAHDFNNMLTVITGTTETLVAGLSDKPHLRHTAALIDQAAQRCTELIQHLLAFARRQPLQPRNVDVNGTITDVAKLLKPTLGEQIEIITALDKQVGFSHVDPSQLANSVLNLAINSRDAMPNGGKLLLETRNVELDADYVEANPDVAPGSYVLIAVSDTGSGMPQSVQDKAFEPFFTTKETGKGSGLGLSMVYGFATQSGGHVRIYSEEGQGTTVKLYLPPAAGDIETAAAPAIAPATGSETILVVEDDTLVRNFVTTQLQGLGYKTVAAADGPAALAHVKNGESFDLLFTDVVMPGGMSGRQLADEVQKLRPGMKVLYTSGYTDSAIMHHGRLEKGVLLLTKPYRKAQLAQMVRQALGNQDVST
ncbi:CHASE3 domain-containing protein [Bradyrhizobium lablabi]|uniref:CHASE3 domain-containing protein n=1 Tax=Bradyrhizobium lablabi TaxID=722472 RepID=UPI001BA9009F|nr:CHASE3 domain-containing protein [Bradyrhizobium lablabi]MBR1122517.1 CHASE3 domain-containing protein [Bradyrhizobium lablabi]